MSAVVLGAVVLIPSVVVAQDDGAPGGGVTLAEPTTSTSSMTTTTSSTSTSSSTSTTTTTTTAPPVETTRTVAEVPTTATPTVAVTEAPSTTLPSPTIAAATVAAAPGPLCTIFSLVRYNTRGPDALCLERVLVSLGYTLVGPDDWFGISSVRALQAYQQTNGLAADGIAGPATAGRLGIWAPSVPPPPPLAPAPLPAGTCTISTRVRYNSRGADALCLERVLRGLGYSFTGPDDWFGASSVRALQAYQRANGLQADGIAGPVTAGRLGIWANAPSPAPPPAPNPQGLPANSGSGRRVVYDRAQQRVWAVESDGRVVKTHRISGRLHEPYAGTYSVYSRSMYTYSSSNPDIKWRYMVRFAYGPDGGRIGFHEIPNKFGVPLQSEAQLGQPLSGGCVRQSTPDAQWMWNWAGIGTKVVVL